jgi:hypothetical protein
LVATEYHLFRTVTEVAEKQERNGRASKNRREAAHVFSLSRETISKMRPFSVPPGCVHSNQNQAGFTPNLSAKQIVRDGEKHRNLAVVNGGASRSNWVSISPSRRAALISQLKNSCRIP